MVRVLGSVEVVGPGGRAVLNGSRQPAILGLLALRAGEVVACDALVDALWGSEPPRTALRSLHSHVSRARLALAEIGLPDAVVTRDPGYLLAVSPSDVDASAFHDLVRAARTARGAGNPGLNWF